MPRPTKGRREGSVRENPPGSRLYQGRLPARLDPHRRPIDGVFTSAAECRRALNTVILELDRGLRVKPTGKPGGPTRRLSNVVEEYIEDRRNDGLDPIALNTVRDYRDTLRNVICHPDANLGHMKVSLIDSPTLDDWLRDLRAVGFSHRRSTKAFAVVRAALAWEVRKGRLAFNPAREVRRTSTKKGRSSRATADPVLLPSWKELADLAAFPQRTEDRLLILTIAWAGLRWSEAISLSVTDLWPTRARLSVSRVFSWDQDNSEWVVEAVKAGVAATVPLPVPLWKALLALAQSRTLEERLGGDLLFRPVRARFAERPPVVVNQSDWGRRVWRPAREAAGLVGDPQLPPLDPRRRALQVKDLRAYAASVVVDSGGTQYEAATLLRHSDVQTTNKYYARAMDERSQDPARAQLRLDLSLTLDERIDALWNAWTQAYPDQTAGLLL